MKLRKIYFEHFCLFLCVAMYSFQLVVGSNSKIYQPKSLQEIAFEPIKKQLLENMDDPRWIDYFEWAKAHNIGLMQQFVNNYKDPRTGKVVSFEFLRPYILLHAAILNKNPEIMQFLFDQGISPFLCDDNGSMSLLSAAIKVRADKIVALLIEKGVDVNQRDNLKNIGYPLLYAVHVVINDVIYENDPWMDLYVESGINISDFTDRAPYKILKLLLDNGADINVQDPYDKRTCLHVACGVSMHHDQDYDLVEFLLAHGANPKIKDDNGRTPRDYLLSKPEALAFFDEKVKKYKHAGAERRNYLHNLYRDASGNIPEID